MISPDELKTIREAVNAVWWIKQNFADIALVLGFVCVVQVLWIAAIARGRE